MELPDLNLLISTFAGKIVLIFLLYLLAWLVFRLSGRLAKYVLGASRITTRQPDYAPGTQANPHGSDCRSNNLYGVCRGHFA